MGRKTGPIFFFIPEEALLLSLSRVTALPAKAQIVRAEFWVLTFLFSCTLPLPKIKTGSGIQYTFTGEFGEKLTLATMSMSMNSSGTPGSPIPVQEAAPPGPGGWMLYAPTQALHKALDV